MDRPTLFVTGAASGIGEAVARRFAERGWFVGLYDRNEAGLERVRAAIGEQNSCCQTVDVTDATAVSAAVNDFDEATNGRMDLLFNSAGILQIEVRPRS